MSSSSAAASPLPNIAENPTPQSQSTPAGTPGATPFRPTPRKPSSALHPVPLADIKTATNGDILSACRLRIFFPIATPNNYPPKIPTVQQFLAELHQPQRSYTLSGELLRIYVILTPAKQCLAPEYVTKFERYLEVLNIKTQTSMQRIGATSSLTKQSSSVTLWAPSFLF